jgi:hypothetical protein
MKLYRNTAILFTLSCLELACADQVVLGGYQHGAGGGATTASSSSSSGIGGGPPCMPIDDGNPCTTDICEGGIPTYIPVTGGTPCGPGNGACDGMGNCVSFCSIGTFDVARTTDLGLSGDPIGLVVGDINFDGLADVVTLFPSIGALSIFNGNGDGYLTPLPSLISGPFSAVQFALADVNNDGLRDAILLSAVGDITSGETQITILPGDFSQNVLSFSGKPSTITLPNYIGAEVIADDFNGDGLIDLAVSGQWTLGAPSPDPAIQIFDGLGDANFLDPISVSTPEGVARHMRSAPFALGKGAADIAYWGGSHLHIVSGGPAFTDLVTGLGVSDPYVVDLQVGDVDHDGLPDVFALTQDPVMGQGFTVFVRGGNADYFPAFGAIIPDLPISMSVADLNGDGYSDVVVQTAAPKDNVTWYLNLSGNDFQAVPLFTAVASASALQVADMDNNGLPDVVALSPGQIGPGEGAVDVYLGLCAP